VTMGLFKKVDNVAPQVEPAVVRTASNQKAKCPKRIIYIEVSDRSGPGRHQESRFQDCVEDLCQWYVSGRCAVRLMAEALARKL